MNRSDVDSTSLKSIGYDSGSSVLEVEFVKGSIYRYSDVPEHVYDEVMTSDSIGAAFGKLIKSGGYVYNKVT